MGNEFLDQPPDLIEDFTKDSNDVSTDIPMENTFRDKKPSICFGCSSFEICLTERCLCVIENHGIIYG